MSKKKSNPFKTAITIIGSLAVLVGSVMGVLAYLNTTYASAVEQKYLREDFEYDRSTRVLDGIRQEIWSIQKEFPKIKTDITTAPEAVQKRYQKLLLEEKEQQDKVDFFKNRVLEQKSK